MIFLALAGCARVSLQLLAPAQPARTTGSHPSASSPTLRPPGRTLHPTPTATILPTEAPQPTPPPDPTVSLGLDLLSMPSEPDPRIDADLSQLTQQGEFSGSVLVARGSQPLLRKGYAFADRSGDLPNTPQTRFRIGSLTKAFTAAAVLQLQDQGKLSTQNTICAYLASCPPAWQKITLHQLLTHTSGIPDYANSDSFAQIADQDCTPAQIIPLFQDLPLDFAPGSQWRYSNSGFVLLGAVIEKVSGQSYAAYLKEHILAPLGMEDTGLDDDDDPIAVGYADSEVQAAPMQMSSLYSAGGLYSTVDDLYRWYRGLTSGAVLPSPLVQQMMTPSVQIQDGTRRSYGYGWFLDGDSSPNWVAHSGRVSGFSAEIIHVQADDTLVVVLSNQENVNAEGIGFRLLTDLPGYSP